MTISQELFDERITNVLDHGIIRGRETIATLVAIGAAESGLDNMAIGDNAKNGTPKGTFVTSGGAPLVDPNTGELIDLHDSLGLGWLQHDSGWLKADEILNGVGWSIEAIRADPEFSLQLLVERPGYILHQGAAKTYLKWNSWMVYPRKSDEFMDAAHASYDRVVPNLL